MYDLIIIGGGAAGFFAALSAKEANPEAKVALLEKSAVLLSKVRISGGGRCNVTHACFDPSLLDPKLSSRGSMSSGLFTGFSRAIRSIGSNREAFPSKAEEDGRIFPIATDPESIIDCLFRGGKVGRGDSLETADSANCQNGRGLYRGAFYAKK